MQGLMMDVPLMISSLIRHADRYHGDTEIVSRTVEGPIHRYTYRDAHARARRLARALSRLGIAPGDRVGTLAWNGYRHFELYYAISGMGAITHTINPRLFHEQLAYIIDDAEDGIVFFDLTFTPLVEKLAAACKGVKHWVAMTDRGHRPQAAIAGLSCYEDLIAAEAVDSTSAVPTVWMNLINYMQQNKLKFSTLKSTTIGGAACPPAMIKTLRDEFGVCVRHGWGMTEMSPVGTLNSPKGKHCDLSEDARFQLSLKQGRPLYGVQMKIVDAEGRELERDGKSAGNLLVRGPWILRRYFKNAGGDPLTPDGWLPTGDVGTIDADGYLQITDRSKDVIKSGGEWISSIELENIAVGHPGVIEAAVSGVRHPKWDERPLLVVVKRPGAVLTKEGRLRFYDGKIAKWWLPDDVVFVDELPHTATGKLSKLMLRERFKDYQLPGS